VNVKLAEHCEYYTFVTNERVCILLFRTIFYQVVEVKKSILPAFKSLINLILWSNLICQKSISNECTNDIFLNFNDNDSVSLIM
jgi:hypothetical protein